MKSTSYITLEYKDYIQYSLYIVGNRLQWYTTRIINILMKGILLLTVGVKKSNNKKMLSNHIGEAKHKKATPAMKMY